MLWRALPAADAEHARASAPADRLSNAMAVLDVVEKIYEKNLRE